MIENNITVHVTQTVGRTGKTCYITCIYDCEDLVKTLKREPSRFAALTAAADWVKKHKKEAKEGDGNGD